jgi:hypothetical protein
MNGNTSEYCFISGRQNISTIGIIILVSTAPSCCTDVMSTNGGILTSITIPVVLMCCPLMEQYLLVLPFLSYRFSVH